MIMRCLRHAPSPPSLVALAACIAIAAFLTLPMAARADTSMLTVYTLNCSGCHGADGVGVPEVGIPNLKEAGRFVRTELGREYLIQVPGLSQSRLDDATAARLLNWILRKFSVDPLPTDFTPYTAEEVSRLRTDKASDAKTRRDAILAEMRRRGLLESGYMAAAPAHH
jgi:hypothetical protein